MLIGWLQAVVTALVAGLGKVADVWRKNEENPENAISGKRKCHCPCQRPIVIPLFADMRTRVSDFKDARTGRSTAGVTAVV